MSRLVSYSMLVIVGMLALLFAVGYAVLQRLDLPLGLRLWLSVDFALAVVFLQYLISPYLLDRILQLRWTSPAELGMEFAQWLSATCRRFNISEPRLGIIEDGTPNAFTYGHGAWNARVVITRGLLEVLEPAEVQAVVAHELGHIKHRDFILMTLVQAIVLVLWLLYSDSRWSERVKSSWWVVLFAYVAYWLGYLASLLLSRVREYMADYASAQITREPNALARALVKIAYGLARTQAVVPQQAGQAQPSRISTRAVGALGIAGTASMRAAVAWFGQAAEPDPRHFTLAARWELFNPWARLAELVSTHPLTALRVKALQRLNRLWGVPDEFDFSEIKPERYPAFMRDLLVMALPWLGLLLGAGLAAANQPTLATLQLGLLPILGLLGGYLLQLLLTYPAGARPAKVLELLSKVQVSHVNPHPVVLEGVLTGRLSPGIPWANDYILQDETGFIACLYRQPFWFLESLFGWLSGAYYVGKRVRLYGWYRRFNAPYVEIEHFEVIDSGKRVKSYYRPFMLGITILGILIVGVVAFLL